MLCTSSATKSCADFFFFVQRGNLKVLHIQSTNRTARRLYAETDFCHDLKSTSNSTEKER